MGTSENDTLFGGFASALLPELDEAELGQFEELLKANDSDLYLWATGERPPPPEYDTALMRRLRAYIEDLK